MAAETLARLSAGLAARQYSSVELTREALARVERSQPPFSGLIESWFQNPKGLIGNAATDAVATISHEKIDVVGIEFAVARLAERSKEGHRRGSFFQ